MQFTHEVEITVDLGVDEVLSHWSEAHALPKYLSHVRATALDDSGDLARVVIVLDGHHIEFQAERTMCSHDTICWQNLGEQLTYILTVCAERTPDATRVCVTVSYDPPGFLFDVIEGLGLSRIFRRNLEGDLVRYASSCSLPMLMPAMAV